MTDFELCSAREGPSQLGVMLFIIFITTPYTRKY